VTHPFARVGRELVPGHWFGSVAVLALGCALAWAVMGFGHGALLAGTVFVASAFVALWNSPLRSAGHEPLDSVRSCAVSSDTVVVLWRPGCPYSSALRRRAAREGLDVHWVNIWRDEDAYELCRSINCGAEETPTAMILDRELGRPVVIPASVPGIREAIAVRSTAGVRGWPARRVHPR
jgi:glutaredoxin